MSTSAVLEGVELDAPLYYLHIPKTAGTAMTRWLRSMYARSDVLPAQVWDDVLALDADELRRARLITGHMGATLLSLLDAEPLVVTTIRDPYARAVSAFEHTRRRTATAFHELAAQTPDLDHFLEHPIGRRLVENVQTRYLAGAMRVPSGNGTTREARSAQLSFDTAPDLTSAEELVARACEQLDACAWVGVVERLDLGLPLLADLLAWPAPRVLDRANLNPPETRALPTERQRDRLLELNALDALVYEHGRRLALDQARRDRRRGAYERRLRAATIRLRGAVTVGFGAPFFGDGWWGVEDSAAGPVRWSGPLASSWIDIPVHRAGPSELEVLVHAAARRELLDGLRLDVDEHPVTTTQHPHEHGVLVRGQVGAGGRPWTRVGVTTPGTVAWNAVHPTSATADRRGVAVAWVRLRELAP